ncbi:endonuclease domain-containing protein, partial [Klebsiella pneumoniae]|uniref:endonuclease domain-containing protein n=3 Tax=Pseudomonadota TaxID=1224 RepID=UPI003563D26F
MPEWTPRDTARARELRNQATPAERMLWQQIDAGKLGAKFSRQMPLGPYFCDFLCRRRKLVVELDGESHLSDQDDLRRDRYMIGQGYRVLRFTNADVLGHVEGVI